MIDYDDEQFKAALNHVAATPEGQLILAVLKDSCGWDMVYQAMDNPQVTQYYAARRGVYGSIRLLIRPEHLKKIEFDYKRKVAKNDDRPTSKHSNASRRAKPAGK